VVGGEERDHPGVCVCDANVESQDRNWDWQTRRFGYPLGNAAIPPVDKDRKEDVCVHHGRIARSGSRPKGSPICALCAFAQSLAFGGEYKGGSRLMLRNSAAALNKLTQCTIIRAVLARFFAFCSQIAPALMSSCQAVEACGKRRGGPAPPRYLFIDGPHVKVFQCDPMRNHQKGASTRQEEER
jgi:hypothetical protein